MNKQNFLALLVVTALVFGGLGYLTGSSNNLNSSKKDTQNQKDTFDAGWEAAKGKLEESGFLPSEISEISGEVNKVNGNKIILKTEPPSPLSDESLKIRKVVVNDNTELYNLKEKSQKQIEAEEKAYEKKLNNSSSANGQEENMQEIKPPEYYNKEKIEIGDIKVGDHVNVKTKNNIKEQKKFEAQKIERESFGD